MRRAEWIWRARRARKAVFRDAPPPYAPERNRHVYFRRSFELSGEAESARVHVCADGRYRLFVTGEPAGFGPARFSPDWICADPYDLAPHLRPGRNVVAVLVHSYGGTRPGTSGLAARPPVSSGAADFFCRGK